MLVSIVVVSYNSQETIIETLDSIKEQTYKNIELIISDDCSKDATLDVTNQWLIENKTRFVRTCVLSVDNNTGICENLNRALLECNGVWIKSIAADDILLPNCIKDNLDFIANNSNVSWISSYVSVYNETFDDNNCIQQKFVIDKNFFYRQASEQLYLLAAWNKISAPSQFIKKSLYDDIGNYDSTYGFEDYVFSLSASEHGYKCYFLDKVTVGYRIHNSTFNSTDTLFNYSFLLRSRKFHRDRCFRYLSKRQIFWTTIIWKFEDVIIALNYNKKTKIMKVMYSYFVNLCRKLGNI